MHDLSAYKPPKVIPRQPHLIPRTSINLVYLGTRNTSGFNHKRVNQALIRSSFGSFASLLSP